MVKKVPTRSASAVSAPGAKGLSLEEALRLHFASLSHFALRSIPFRIDGEDVTDIDLWVYERPAGVARRRAIIDVKNKKSPQAAERLVWVKGLQAALGADAALVATTDRRPSTQRLARSLKVGLLDHVPFDKMIEAFGKQTELIGQGSFEVMVRDADAARHSTEWRTAVDAVKASLITSLGFQSANRCLRLFKTVYEEVVMAPAGSSRAMAGSRLLYFISAGAAISLDYAMAEHMWRTKDERIALAAAGIRFGSTDVGSALAKIRAASSLVEKYLKNGRHLSKVLESAFMVDAENVHSEIIAEHIGRQSSEDALFSPACDLLAAALAVSAPSFDELSPKAKSLLGVFLDFNGGSRERLAMMWAPEVEARVEKLTQELPLPSTPQKSDGPGAGK